jgi:hypothetical protein
MLPEHSHFERPKAFEYPLCNIRSGNIPGNSNLFSKNIAEKIPDIDTIDTKKSADSRLMLRFNDKDFYGPFQRPTDNGRLFESLCIRFTTGRSGPIALFYALKSLKTNSTISSSKP